MKTVIVSFLSLGLFAAPGLMRGSLAASAPDDGAACGSAGDLSFVCGVVNVEDFLPVEGGKWLVGSSYADSGGLYLIDTAAKSAKPVSLSISATPDPIYAGCPSSDLKKLRTHGLDVTTDSRGNTTVLAVNHGGHESVEVFHLDAEHASAQWIGCVLLPPNVSGNAVSGLPGSSFVVTKFTGTGAEEAVDRGYIAAGKATGAVFLWRPGKGFSEVPGTVLSGDNGILTSTDGKWIYVNAYGSHEIYRVPLFGKGRRTSVKVDFLPDNLRWAPDGQIFVTGQLHSRFMDRSRRPPDGWATVRLNPKTMKITALVREAGMAQFDDASSTVQVAETLWFGTFHGDRVAYREATR